MLKKSDCRVKDEENVPNAELIDSSPAGGVLGEFPTI